MVHRAIIIIAWVCCFFVVASFSLIAIDQMAGASKHQQNEITSSAIQPIPPEAQHHSQPRQFIDDAAHTLTSPVLRRLELTPPARRPRAVVPPRARLMPSRRRAPRSPRRPDNRSAV